MSRLLKQLEYQKRLILSSHSPIWPKNVPPFGQLLFPNLSVANNNQIIDIVIGQESFCRLMLWKPKIHIMLYIESLIASLPETMLSKIKYPL